MEEWRILSWEDKEMAEYQDCTAKISTLNLFSNGKRWLSFLLNTVENLFLHRDNNLVTT